MNTSCVGGREQKLVDARFLRDLDTGERERLEHHLAACAFCSERYRRMQLAHRVAAGGEAALDEPSPLEIERIGRDLGFEDPPKRKLSWLLNARFMAFAATSAVALGAAMFMFVPRDDGLVARGGKHTDVSFAAYVISPDGAIRAHDASLPAKRKDYLKLRVELGAGIELGGVDVGIVSKAAEARVTHLESPGAPSNGGAASVPGAVSLDVTPGRAVIYVIAERSAIDGAKITSAIAAKPDAETLARTLGTAALSVERLELDIAEGD